MRVDANSEHLGAPATRPARAKAREIRPNEAERTAGSSEKLVDALKQIPTVRAEKVAQARTLLNDPSYPSDAVLRKVASVLTDHIRTADKTP